MNLEMQAILLGLGAGLGLTIAFYDRQPHGDYALIWTEAGDD